ncbi:hypothetical protein TNCV_3739391 [Trichonephila clavipes]|nr:hypothetical protein TNCV_3739391 [Trichonephila clavipes]
MQHSKLQVNRPLLWPQQTVISAVQLPYTETEWCVLVSGSDLFSPAERYTEALPIIWKALFLSSSNYSFVYSKLLCNILQITPLFNLTGRSTTFKSTLRVFSIHYE